MTTTELEYLRNGPAEKVSQFVDSSTDLSNEELRAALSNALTRVAEVEARWELLNSALQRFHELYPDSATVLTAVDGHGAGSLKPTPARSYEQTRVITEIPGCTKRKLEPSSPPPASKMTVGSPLPLQKTFKCRPGCTSTSQWGCVYSLSGMGPLVTRTPAKLVVTNQNSATTTEQYFIIDPSIRWSALQPSRRRGGYPDNGP